MTTLLTPAQKTALIRVRMAADTFYNAMNELNNCWDTLETTNAPIGFMDTMYPFNEKFNIIQEDTKLWVDHISNKATEIIYQTSN